MKGCGDSWTAIFENGGRLSHERRHIRSHVFVNESADNVASPRDYVAERAYLSILTQWLLDNASLIDLFVLENSSQEIEKAVSKRAHIYI